MVVAGLEMPRGADYCSSVEIETRAAADCAHPGASGSTRAGLTAYAGQ